MRLLLLLVAAGLAAGEVHALPARWGQEDGNPLPVDGQPRWRLDQILPANPEDAAAYLPMAWSGHFKAWFNEKGSQGGQPRAAAADGNLVIEVRARGGGNVDYVKGAALVFIAPRDGRWSLAVERADVRRWEGGTTTQLLGLRRFRKGEAWSVEPVSREALKPEPGNQPKPIEASLKRGDELALVPWHDGHWSGATITLVKPSATLVGDATATAAIPAGIPFAVAAGEDARGRPLPASCGYADVRAYGAKGDGVSDDTAAIQRAISENRNRGGRVVYLPAGTYLVSGTLSYGDNLEQAKFLTIQGQGRDLTTIRLKDRCPGFAQRKAVLSQFEGKTTGMAFNNSVYDLTIDVGAGNPGAVALEWMNNNSGSCERVALRSSDPERAGLAGFDLSRHEPGPGLVRDLLVDGFDYGVLSVQTCFSMTFEGLTLRHQRKAGIRNNTQTLFLRRVDSENAVPAIVFADETPYGGIAVYDSVFTGTGPAAAAGAAIVAGQPQVALRNVRQRGYAKLVDLSRAKLPDLAGAPAEDGGSAQAGDWFAKPAPRCSAWDGAAPATFGLPVEETPLPAWDPPERWAVVDPRRLAADYDDAPAIQEALDWAAKTGRTSLLVPGGSRVLFGSPIRVPAQIRRITGLDALSGLTVDMARSGGAVWRVEAGSEPLVIERFFNEDFARALPARTCTWVEHASQRPLIIAHGATACTAYRGLPASKGAKVFLDDLTIPDQAFTGQQVFMRQYNPESNGVMCSAEGGSLWVFGTKTESETGTWFRVAGGARAEILGGYLYPSWRNQHSPPPKPLFVVEEGSALCATFKEQVFQGYMCYPVIIRQTRGGETRDLGRDCLIGNGWAPLALALPKP